MQARIFILGGSSVGQSFDVEGSATIGRDAECEISLGDKSISRRHARVHWDGRRWLIEDLDSRNGTRIRDHRVRTGELADRDELFLGKVPLRFLTAGGPPSPPLDGDLGEEIHLEGAEPEPAAPARQAPPGTTGVREAPPSRLSGRDQERAHLMAENKSGGLLRGDISQQPYWVRLVLTVVLIAVAGTIAYFVFDGLRSFRASNQAPALSPGE